MSSKQRIGNTMFFADPIVWIRYKHDAYQGTQNALTTWGDLVDHSLSHDGICGKRLHWLQREVANRGIDIFSSAVIPRETPLYEVALHPEIVAIADSPVLMQTWNEHEYYQERGVPKKWARYPIAY
jgi:hypothetical protein